MLVKRLSILLIAVAASGRALAQEPPGLQIRTTRPDATVTFEKSVADGKALVNVRDTKQEPVLGLTGRDFTVAKAGEAGKVISAEPISRTAEVSRHIVLVLDNSDSMRQRKAIPKVLELVGAVVKTVRPIDDASIVVLREKPTVKVGTRNLHEETFRSNKPSDLEAFAAKAFKKDNITQTTALYEGMLAGLELIRNAPANDPRFLLVFTDGEDINSAFKGDVVGQAAKGIPNLHVFAVDYMPDPKVDPFLSSFASQNGGQARKPGASADLPALLEKFATKPEHHYVVAFEFAPPAPPPPPPPSPKTMTFGAAALFDFNKADLKAEGKEQIKAYREKAKAEMSSAGTVKITGHTDSVGTPGYNMKLSLRRAQAVRDYLVSLGVDPGKLEVRGEGETKPVADNKTAEGRAKNRRVEVEVIGLGK